MLRIQNFNNKQISFGTTERHSNTNLGSEYDIRNHCYIDRPDEDPAEYIIEQIVKKSKNYQKVDMNIWGCSDLSSYLTKALAFRRILDKDTFDKTFPQINLKDIDPELITRAKKGLIGLTESDLYNLNIFHELWADDFVKLPEDEAKNFFIDGEEKRVLSARLDELFEYGEHAIGEEDVVPHRFNKDLLRNTNIGVGDIRTDMKKLAPPDKNNLRVFEFANSWYFLPKKDQINLAFDITQKLNVKDLIILGKCEISRGVANILNTFGFDIVQDSSNLFEKIKNLNPQTLQNKKNMMLKFPNKYIG